MRDFAIGDVLLLALLGLQIQPGSARGADWFSLGLFWLCLWADPAAGVAIAWAGFWGIEAASAAPGGMLGSVYVAAAAGALVARQWVRRDSTVAALLFTGFFSALTLAGQALWLTAAGEAELADLRPQAWRILTATLLAALVLVPILQVGLGRFLGRTEPFAP